MRDCYDNATLRLGFSRTGCLATPRNNRSSSASGKIAASSPAPRRVRTHHGAWRAGPIEPQRPARQPVFATMKNLPLSASRATKPASPIRTRKRCLRGGDDGSQAARLLTARLHHMRPVGFALIPAVLGQNCVSESCRSLDSVVLIEITIFPLMRLCCASSSHQPPACNPDRD